MASTGWPPAMKAAVVLNASAGSIAASEASATVSRVRDAFERSGVEAAILGIWRPTLGRAQPP